MSLTPPKDLDNPNNNPTNHDSPSTPTTSKIDPDSGNTIVYESPLGHVVSRLRAMSVTTAVLGSIGLPLFVSLKPEMPEMGLLCVAMAFVSGSIGSTAIVHWVFGPYVYRIEHIPVRKCHSKKEATDTAVSSSNSTDTVECTSNKEAAAAGTKVAGQAYLYKAITKGLFLNRLETVFDVPDVQPYKGMRLMCNFVACQRLFYVHPAVLHDAALREQMQLQVPEAVPPPKDNPDDFL
jgi:hypothetical protein